MTRPAITGDEEEMLEEMMERESIDSTKKMVEALIHDAYDEKADAGYVYDPREERSNALSTDEIQDILWRYDAPAVNPGHIKKWPRDRPDKRRLLAAIGRYEGVEADRESVEELISEHLGEGDWLQVPVDELGGVVQQMEQEKVRRPRNIYHYARDILSLLREYPSEDADNLPDEFHLEPALAPTPQDVDTVEEFRAKAERVIEVGDEKEAKRMTGQASIEPVKEHPRGDEVMEVIEELYEFIED